MKLRDRLLLYTLAAACGLAGLGLGYRVGRGSAPPLLPLLEQAPEWPEAEVVLL